MTLSFTHINFVNIFINEYEREKGRVWFTEGGRISARVGHCHAEVYVEFARASAATSRGKHTSFLFPASASIPYHAK